MHGDKRWEWTPPGGIAVAAFGLIFFFLLSPSVHAHRVHVFAWIEGEQVHTESYLGGKRRAAGGDIRVFDLSGTRLIQGRTDENGKFSFPYPGTGDLRIVLEAGMGHRAEYLLRALETGSPAGPSARVRKAQKTVPQSPAARLDRAEIRAVVEEVLDRKLAPIKKELARKGETPGFREIMAGIGYIVGIMGLVLYFRGRKGQKPPREQG